MKLNILVIATLLGACNLNSNGIHTIGSDAVYIAGEACTVNMTLDRSEEEIATDMEICLALHKGYSHE